MRCVFLTGIWPPDVGGPATHGPDFAGFLRDRGHHVEVVTMADSEPAERPVPVHAVARTRPFVVRYPNVALVGARLARGADLVYATGTYGAAAAASTASRRPLVVKLVSDPAYERARRYGVFRGSLEAFQPARGARIDALKRLRTASLRRAARIVVPSRYLAEMAVRWHVDTARVEVLVNPAPPAVDAAPARLPAGTFVFVGRLTEQKALPVLLDAVDRVDGARLVVVGDGPERERLERRASKRVTFTGPLPRAEVLAQLAGARAAVLSSAWENLPHAAVEALAVGTPVVATAVGGVPEVVTDGSNGLLVPPNDADAFANALRRLLVDDDLHARLAANAKPSVAAIGRDAVYERLERILLDAAARR
ncbi:MAG TPA: glycosyltransferase family 4 protein [Gaiellaceae bacterium]|nr:glycosyltransferase family 4 protein [Gaiellaceae bacterium]